MLSPAVVVFAALTWIGHPDFNGPVEAEASRFCRFRNEFQGQGTLSLEVTADERYILFLDGRRIDRGPDRSSPAQWSSRKLVLDPGPGGHRLEAVVWQVGDHAPYAQMSSGRGGFALAAAGAYAETLSTSSKGWKVGRIDGAGYLSCGGWGACAFGNMFEDASGGFAFVEPGEWKQPAVVQRPITQQSFLQGARSDLWMVEASRLPQQMDRIIAPGEFKAAADCFDVDNRWTESDVSDVRVKALNALWRESRPFTLKPGERFRALLDLGDYYCAYPELVVYGGRGGEVRVGWSEALRDEKGLKGDRNAFIGKGEYHYADRFHPKGGENSFTTPWWRCGRWMTLEARAEAEPLEIHSFRLSETRYPLADESSFDCDDPTLAGVRRLCQRGLEMCAHDMTFDCPYYEQQMYPGDSRVQLNVHSVLSADDRLVRRVIELFDFSRQSDGTVLFNYPSRHRQVGAVYTLCHLLMYGDYVRWHADFKWLRKRIPGIRQTVAGLSAFENEDGLLVNLPGWGFTDWVPGWERGVAPDAESKDRPAAINNLLWVLALQSVAEAEDVAGEPEAAALCRRKARQVAEAVRTLFFDAGRGLIADDLAHAHFSEHAQCLAILGGVLDGASARDCFNRMLTDGDLARCTVYFSYYLFETYFRFGRGDLFLKRLDLWRDYVRSGLSTPLERPDVRDANGRIIGQSRSDCHAWGAHPLYFMTTGLAGITPAAIGFRKVRIAPSPGDLKWLSARCPHPNGVISVRLAHDGGNVSGNVVLPPGVEGYFVWHGREHPLRPGENMVSASAEPESSTIMK